MSHFADTSRRAHAARTGVWVFLASELMFFAALFALYGAYRARDPRGFALGASHNSLLLGTVNTVVLVTSSFVVATGTWFMREGRGRAVAACYALAAACGAAFLALKGIEYAGHVEEGSVPGTSIFRSLYFGTTGLHGLHVLAGMVVLVVVGARAARGRYGAERDEHVAVEAGALYWHLVDVVWLFLWPAFYLLREAA